MAVLRSINSFLLAFAFATGIASAGSDGASSSGDKVVSTALASIDGVLLVQGPFTYDDGTEPVGYVIRLKDGNRADFMLCSDGSIMSVDLTKLKKAAKGCPEPKPDAPVTASVDCQTLALLVSKVPKESDLVTGTTFKVQSDSSLSERGVVSPDTLKQWSTVADFGAKTPANPCGSKATIQIPVSDRTSWIGVVRDGKGGGGS